MAFIVAKTNRPKLHCYQDRRHPSRPGTIYHEGTMHSTATTGGQVSRARRRFTWCTCGTSWQIPLRQRKACTRSFPRRGELAGNARLAGCLHRHLRRPAALCTAHFRPCCGSHSPARTARTTAAQRRLRTFHDWHGGLAGVVGIFLLCTFRHRTAHAPVPWTHSVPAEGQHGTFAIPLPWPIAVPLNMPPCSAVESIHNGPQRVWL